MNDRNGLSKKLGALFIALLLFLGSALARKKSVAAVSIAQVKSVRGQLFVRHKGAKSYVPLQVGKPVFGGDIVRTGAQSRAIILLTNRAELELGATMAMEMPLPVEPTKLLPRQPERAKGANR